MNMKIKIGILLAACALLLAAPTSAQVNDTSVVNSGDKANINSSVNDISKIDVNNFNQATVNQNVNVEANTGNNTANRNIDRDGGDGGGTNITTGDAVAAAALSVTANQNTTVIEGTGATAPLNKTDVVNTGDKTHVNTDVNTDSRVNVDNINIAHVKQNVDVKANTGGNEASRNIAGKGDPSIKTGDATALVSADVNVNRNTTLISDGKDQKAADPNITTVTNTGDKTNINTHLNSSSSVDVNNVNVADVWQNVYATSNTGWNQANKNIGDTNIKTGDAKVKVDLAVNANKNFTAIKGQPGLAPFNYHKVVNTGDELYSNAEVNSDNQTKVKNWNDLNSWQWAWQKSNSGWNDASSNISKTGIYSGHAALLGGYYDVLGNSNYTTIGGSLIDP